MYLYFIILKKNQMSYTCALHAKWLCKEFFRKYLSDYTKK